MRPLKIEKKLRNQKKSRKLRGGGRWVKGRVGSGKIWKKSRKNQEKTRKIQKKSVKIKKNHFFFGKRGGGASEARATSRPSNGRTKHVMLLVYIKSDTDTS